MNLPAAVCGVSEGIISRQELKTLKGFSDEELAARAQGGSSAAVSLLLSRMSPMIRAKASKYRVRGVDTDDLAQEGMLGLLSAIYSYNSGSGAGFATYASVCAANRMTSFARSSLRQKRRPPDGYDDLDDDIVDVKANPEEQVIAGDELSRMKRTLFHRLSETERDVITLYLAGHSYDEIAARLGLSAKSVDNALQRVRKKLRPPDI